MRKRQISVMFRLNEQEQQHLKKQVALSGYSTEQYIRSLIAGANMKPRPPGEIAEILRQLSAIGNNINQIAKVANSRGSLRKEELEHIMLLQSKIWQMVKRL